MNDPEDINANIDPMSDPEFEHLRWVDPEEEDMLEEAERMGYRDGRRGPTVDGSGQGLNSDEV